MIENLGNFGFTRGRNKPDRFATALHQVDTPSQRYFKFIVFIVIVFLYPIYIFKNYFRKWFYFNGGGSMRGKFAIKQSHNRIRVRRLYGQQSKNEAGTI